MLLLSPRSLSLSSAVSLSTDTDVGSIKWTFSSGAPLVSFFNHESVERLIPSSLDGTLFSFDGDKLQRMGVDIQELVNRAPSINDEHAWTGAKSARLFLLDLTNGDVVRELSSDFFLNRDSLPSNMLLVGRSDYSLQGTDRMSPLKIQLWNMSYSTFVADYSMDAADDSYPYILSSELGTSSVCARSKRGGQQKLWELGLSSIPVALFRVHHVGDSATLIQVKDFLDKSERHEALLLAPELSGNNRLPERDGVSLVTDGTQSNTKLSFLLQATIPALASSEVATCEWNPSLGARFFAVLVPAALVIGSVAVVSLRFSRSGFDANGRGTVARSSRKANKKKKQQSMVQPLSKILVKDRVLGYGSGGTVVYEGTLEGRRIAVKRMLKAFYDIAER